MKSQITMMFLVICFTEAFLQVKEDEIFLKTKEGQAKLIKFKDTEIADDLQAVNIFLKSQYKTVSDVEFQAKKESNI